MAVFGEFHAVLVAVNGSTGRKDEAFTIVFLHDFEQIDGTTDIVFVVAEWLLDGFGDGFKSGEVNHEIEMIFLKSLVEIFFVQEVDKIEFWFDIRNFLDIIESGDFAIDEII